MIEQLNQDIKTAMKAKEKEKLAAIRYLKSMLLENQTSKNPKPEMDIVIKHVKKLKDSVESYPADNPMREQIQNEIAFLEVYMPKQLDEAEVNQMIDQIISSLGDSPQMGGVMKELTPKIKGMFDGKKASQMVKDKLNS